MQTELHVSTGLIFSFLLVLARVAGTIIYVPLPGFQSTPEPVRALLVLSLTMALYPFWPVIPADPGFLLFTGWLLTEAAFGLCIGLLVGFLADAALLFGQICGMQAGYSYASTVDPASQADSPVLSALAQSAAGLLFVTLGLHRHIIRLFAESLKTQPPGQLILNPRWSEVLIHAAGSMFSVGLRLALPVVGLLTLVDLTLALLGRINSQLQLLSLAMPLKMLAALAMISVLLMLFPTVYSQYAEQLFRIATRLSR
jgi:flagellar biosynthetic protein FliR